MNATPRTADDFRQAIKQLLPPGRAFDIEPDSNLDKLLSGLAQEPARANVSGFELIDEAKPDQTDELLPDWEQEAGLPDDCAPAVQTEEQRRDALVQKLTSNDTVTTAFLQAAAEQLGFAVTVVKRHRRCYGGIYKGCLYGDPYGGKYWNYVIEIHAGATNVQMRTYGGAHFGEAYASWGNSLLECVLAKLIGVGKMYFIYS